MVPDPCDDRLSRPRSTGSRHATAPPCVHGGVRRLSLPSSALALAALALTAACSAGTSSPEPSAVASLDAGSGAATPTAEAPSPAVTTPAPPTSAAPAGRQLTLVVSGKDVTGDTGTVDVKLGEPIHLTVTSDVADEVHVHGADVSADVDAGGTVELDFVQNAPGRFEIELEGAKRTLTRLQVS